ncbi:MAG: hypothetical protein ABI199_08660 [Bacteroidia bacterium]
MNEKLKIVRKIIFLMAFLALPVMAFSQENAAQKSPPTSRAQRQADKKAWKQKRLQDRAEKKKIRDYQKETQTKKVQKRMRKDRRHAARVNQNKREFFVKRWFEKRATKK